MLEGITVNAPRETIAPPPPLYQFLEARAGMEFAALLLMLPLLRRSAPKGAGQPVLVLPGFMADDNATWVLRRFLDDIGYSVTGWQMGRNIGPSQPLLDALVARCEKLRRGHDLPLNLVGWSRGGIMARELARVRPDLIRHVITLGSPVRGGPASTSIGRLVQASTGMSEADMLALVKQRERTPITTPITALYSKTDGVVAWRAALDEINPNVDHIEVASSHIGFAVNAQVYRIVAQRLHEPRPQSR